MFAALALSSVLALSFLPVYHLVYDTGILTLVLAWIFGAAAGDLKHIVPDQRDRLTKRIAFALFLLLLLPIQSVAIRAHSYLSPQAAQPWWWNSVIAPYTSWTLLDFSALLLYALLVSHETHELAPTPPLKVVTEG